MGPFIPQHHQEGGAAIAHRYTVLVCFYIYYILYILIFSMFLYLLTFIYTAVKTWQLPFPRTLTALHHSVLQTIIYRHTKQTNHTSNLHRKLFPHITKSSILVSTFLLSLLTFSTHRVQCNVLSSPPILLSKVRLRMGSRRRKDAVDMSGPDICSCCRSGEVS